MNTLQVIRTIFLCSLTLFLLNCSQENSNQEIHEASVSVKLVDAPGDFDAVNVEVLDIHLKVIDDETNPNCWVSLNAINTGIYNLLDLTGGVEALLVDNLMINERMIYEIKLVLGNDNTIVIDGQTLPLATPSVHQEGLSVRVEQLLQRNNDYTFILDFDVDQSILFTNTPDYIILKPHIRYSLESFSGSIEGKLSSQTGQTKVIVNTKKGQLSTYVDQEGNFSLRGVPEGNYSISIQEENNIDIQTISNNVQVIKDSNTDLGIISLN